MLLIAKELVKPMARLGKRSDVPNDLASYAEALAQITKSMKVIWKVDPDTFVDLSDPSTIADTLEWAVKQPSSKMSVIVKDIMTDQMAYQSRDINISLSLDANLVIGHLGGFTIEGMFHEIGHIIDAQSKEHNLRYLEGVFGRSYWRKIETEFDANKIGEELLRKFNLKYDSSFFTKSRLSYLFY